MFSLTSEFIFFPIYPQINSLVLRTTDIHLLILSIVFNLVVGHPPSLSFHFRGKINEQPSHSEFHLAFPSNFRCGLLVSWLYTSTTPVIIRCVGASSHHGRETWNQLAPFAGSTIKVIPAKFPRYSIVPNSLGALTRRRVHLQWKKSGFDKKSRDNSLIPQPNPRASFQRFAALHRGFFSSETTDGTSGERERKSCYTCVSCPRIIEFLEMKGF